MDNELKRRIVECLNEALEADNHIEAKYHIRQALQLISTDGETKNGNTEDNHR